MNRYAELPPLPERINRLDQLAVDLWWSWNRRWTRSLQTARLHLVARDRAQSRFGCCGSCRATRSLRRPAILSSCRSTTRALARPRRRARGAQHVVDHAATPNFAADSIAYFSAEFALHQSLPIYAGGLGVLAGDHCKEASDLGVPLIGIGFMYPQGYFHQHVSAEGWQEESYERLNWADVGHREGHDARRNPAASPRCRSASGRCSCRCGACAPAA